MYYHGGEELPHSTRASVSSEQEAPTNHKEQQFFSSLPILKAFGSNLLSPTYIQVTKRTKARGGVDRSSTMLLYWKCWSSVGKGLPLLE